MTKTDKDKLFQTISADFKIIARKTGLWKMEYCGEILHDIGVLLENDFLSNIYLIMKGSDGRSIRCNKYDIKYSKFIDSDDRPGENDWDGLGGIQLTVVLSYTSSWRNLQEPTKSNFIRDLKIRWFANFEDLTFPHLKSNFTKKYSSPNLHIQRTDFK